MITYRYPTTEEEIQQLYKLTSMKDITEWLGGAIIPPILREGAKKKELIIAKDEDKVIGFISFHKRKDGYTTVHYRAVHPDYRGQGIAKKLTSFLRPPMMAKCKAENVRIQSLYTSLGMTKVKAETHKKKDGSTYTLFTYKTIL